jgi:hypothetical protein
MFRLRKNSFFCESENLKNLPILKTTKSNSMLTRKILTLATCTALVLTTACTRLFFGIDLHGTPRETYDDLCLNIEQRYSLFEQKKIDWPAVKARYASQLRDSMDKEELFAVLGGLLGELQDGHVNIYTDWDVARNWDWYLDYPANFNFNIVERNYLGKHHRRSGPFLVSKLDSIGYVYYSSFSTPLREKSLENVLDYLADCRGIVLDIRSNGGGKLDNTRLIASHFADTTRTALQFHFKSGPGAGDFDGPFPYEIKPSKKSRYLKPVVILTNRKSYSAATFFPAIMAAFPQVTIMGDTTGGGGGIPWQFELANGWTYRFSTSNTIDSKGRNIEFGIPPDVVVQLDPADECCGVDTMIERAFEFLRKR